jgi:hypothetical protein
MLQGVDRLDRFYKYRRHILQVAASSVLYATVSSQLDRTKPLTAAVSSSTDFPAHSVIYSPGLGHDPLAMLHSPAGKCAIFRIGCVDSRRLSPIPFATPQDEDEVEEEEEGIIGS